VLNFRRQRQIYKINFRATSLSSINSSSSNNNNNNNNSSRSGRRAAFAQNDISIFWERLFEEEITENHSRDR
jgi:hypothetical protein